MEQEWTPGQRGKAAIYGSLHEPQLAGPWAVDAEGYPNHYVVMPKHGIYNFIALEVDPEGGVSVLFGDPQAADDATKLDPRLHVKSRGPHAEQSWDFTGHASQARRGPSRARWGPTQGDPSSELSQALRTAEIASQPKFVDVGGGMEYEHRDGARPIIGVPDHNKVYVGPPGAYHGEVYPAVWAGGSPSNSHSRGLMYPNDDGTHRIEWLDGDPFNPHEQTDPNDEWRFASTDLHSWEPGTHGKGFVLNDGTPVTWTTKEGLDMQGDTATKPEYMGPHHSDYAKRMGLSFYPEGNFEDFGVKPQHGGWHTPVYIKPDGTVHQLDYWPNAENEGTGAFKGLSGLKVDTSGEWHFAAWDATSVPDDWHVQESDFNPDETFYSPMTGAPDRHDVRTVVVHKPTRQIIVGKPGTHHGDLIHHHGLDFEAISDLPRSERQYYEPVEDSAYNWTSEDGPANFPSLHWGFVENNGGYSSVGRPPAGVTEALHAHGLLQQPDGSVVHGEPDAWHFGGLDELWDFSTPRDTMTHKAITLNDGRSIVEPVGPGIKMHEDVARQHGIQGRDIAHYWDVWGNVPRHVGYTNAVHGPASRAQAQASVEAELARRLGRSPNNPVQLDEPGDIDGVLPWHHFIVLKDGRVISADAHHHEIIDAAGVGSDDIADMGGKTDQETWHLNDSEQAMRKGWAFGKTAAWDFGPTVRVVRKGLMTPDGQQHEWDVDSMGFPGHVEQAQRLAPEGQSIKPWLTHTYEIDDSGKVHKFYEGAQHVREVSEQLAYADAGRDDGTDNSARPVDSGRVGQVRVVQAQHEEPDQSEQDESWQWVLRPSDRRQARSVRQSGGARQRASDRGVVRGLQRPRPARWAARDSDELGGQVRIGSRADGSRVAAEWDFGQLPLTTHKGLTMSDGSVYLEPMTDVPSDPYGTGIYVHNDVVIKHGLNDRQIKHYWEGHDDGTVTHEGFGDAAREGHDYSAAACNLAQRAVEQAMSNGQTGRVASAHMLHGFDMNNPQWLQHEGEHYDDSRGGWGKGMTTEAGHELEWHVGPEWGPHHADVADDYRTFPDQTWIIDPAGNRHMDNHEGESWSFAKVAELRPAQPGDKNTCPKCGSDEWEHQEYEQGDGYRWTGWHCTWCGHAEEDRGLRAVGSLRSPESTHWEDQQRIWEQPQQSHHELNWKPGTYGKGLLENDGSLRTWTCDENGNPHHDEMERGKTTDYLLIDPGGETDSASEAHGHALDANVFKIDPRLKPAPEDWHFASLDAEPVTLSDGRTLEWTTLDDGALAVLVQGEKREQDDTHSPTPHAALNMPLEPDTPATSELGSSTGRTVQALDPPAALPDSGAYASELRAFLDAPLSPVDVPLASTEAQGSRAGRVGIDDTAEGLEQGWQLVEDGQAVGPALAPTTLGWTRGKLPTHAHAGSHARYLAALAHAHAAVKESRPSRRELPTYASIRQALPKSDGRHRTLYHNAAGGALKVVDLPTEGPNDPLRGDFGPPLIYHPGEHTLYTGTLGDHHAALMKAMPEGSAWDNTNSLWFEDGHLDGQMDGISEEAKHEIASHLGVKPPVPTDEWRFGNRGPTGTLSAEGGQVPSQKIQVHVTDDEGTAGWDMDELFDRRRPILYSDNNLYVGGPGQYHSEAAASHGLESEHDHARGMWTPEGVEDWQMRPGDVQWFTDPPSEDEQYEIATRLRAQTTNPLESGEWHFGSAGVEGEFTPGEMHKFYVAPDGRAKIWQTEYEIDGRPDHAEVLKADGYTPAQRYDKDDNDKPGWTYGWVDSEGGVSSVGDRRNEQRIIDHVQGHGQTDWRFGAKLPQVSFTTAIGTRYKPWGQSELFNRPDRNTGRPVLYDPSRNWIGVGPESAHHSDITHEIRDQLGDEAQWEYGYIHQDGTVRAMSMRGFSPPVYDALKEYGWVHPADKEPDYDPDAWQFHSAVAAQNGNHQVTNYLGVYGDKTTTPWAPGMLGKGAILDGTVHTWAYAKPGFFLNTADYFDPHHDGIFAHARGLKAEQMYDDKHYGDYNAMPKFDIAADGTLDARGSRTLTPEQEQIVTQAVPGVKSQAPADQWHFGSAWDEYTPAHALIEPYEGGHGKGVFLRDGTPQFWKVNDAGNPGHAVIGDRWQDLDNGWQTSYHIYDGVVHPHFPESMTDAHYQALEDAGLKTTREQAGWVFSSADYGQMALPDATKSRLYNTHHGDAEPWEMGKAGKGFIHNGQGYLWRAEPGDPHHPDMLMTVEPSYTGQSGIVQKTQGLFTVTPEGKVNPSMWQHGDPHQFSALHPDLHVEQHDPGEWHF